MSAHCLLYAMYAGCTAELHPNNSIEAASPQVEERPADVQNAEPVRETELAAAVPEVSTPAGAVPLVSQAMLQPMAADAGVAAPTVNGDAGATPPPTVTAAPEEATPAQPDGGVQETLAGEALWPEDCDEHFVFHAHGRPTDADPTKYAMLPGEERVATFYFKSPWGQPAAQLVQSRERMDNRKLIHHWMLYLIDTAEHPDGSILDDNNLQSLSTLLNQQSLVGGIPGSGDLTLPADVGLRLPDNEQTYALSVHYLNATEATQRDASGIEVCVTNRARPHEAATHWLGRGTFTLPPRTETRVSGTCNPVAITEPVHILSANPHMHRFGTHANLDLQRVSGETITLLDVPYAFDDQKVYDISATHQASELLLGNGDRLLTTCTFDNTTDRVVQNGEQASDEMCFMGVVAWPAGSLANGNVLAGFNGLSQDQACVE